MSSVGVGDLVCLEPVVIHQHRWNELYIVIDLYTIGSFKFAKLLARHGVTHHMYDVLEKVL